MMIENKRVRLKDGRECILRALELKDAEQLIDFLKATTGETSFLLISPDEVTMTVEQEQDFLNKFINSERDLMILSEVNGRIAGNCSFSPVGAKNRNRHRCAFGIALYQEFWGLGIGTALLDLLLEKAKECGYEQAELEVVSKNERAIALYQKLGFVKVGVMPHAMRYADGTYDDNIIMVKQLEQVEKLQ